MRILTGRTLSEIDVG